ncbi:MAG: antibiotic biosynthesis monooxygenase [Flavobacteriales bacterium]|nr:antibiotic biosynthesis monooxygenase [Flavobacteriales bacterium]MCB9168281.1 antibiotic biosynthesis monooxygenase [Flavobacteriales bacterium]
MIVRLVRMTFRADGVDRFLQIFEDLRHRIIAMPGCQHLELLQDLDDPRVLTTYSHWRSPEDLERYRGSDLFASEWPAVKALFEFPAEAWSNSSLHRMLPQAS